MFLNKKYELTPIENDNEFFGVRIIDGDYRGIVIKYNDIQVIEINEDDTCEFKYSFDIVDVPPKLIDQELSKTGAEEFENIVKEILLDILSNFEIETRKNIKEEREVCD